MHSIQNIIREHLEISISNFLYEAKHHSQLVSAIIAHLVDLDDEASEHVLAILKYSNNK